MEGAEIIHSVEASALEPPSLRSATVHDEFDTKTNILISNSFFSVFHLASQILLKTSTFTKNRNSYFSDFHTRMHIQLKLNSDSNSMSKSNSDTRCEVANFDSIWVLGSSPFALLVILFLRVIALRLGCFVHYSFCCS
jgi:hypothetical protein